MGDMIGSATSSLGNLFGSAASSAPEWGAGYGGDAMGGFGNFANTAGTTVANQGGNWLGNMAPYALPAASIGMKYLEGQQTQNRSKDYNQSLLNASQQNQQTWQQNAYPQAGAVNAMNKQLRGSLGEARLQSTQNMANQLAARGIGAGSGMMGQRQGDIEQAYLKGLGSGITDIQKFANTAQYPMPGVGYYSPQLQAAGGAETATGQASSLFDTYYGYTQMQKLIQDIMKAGGK
jgi:hypothetical protein